MAGTPVGISRIVGQNTEQRAEQGRTYARALPAKTPQVTTGTLPKRTPKKKIMDPGLNPLSATKIGEQAREAAMVNRRVALNTSETWAPGALEKVTHLIGEFQARLEDTGEGEAVADNGTIANLPHSKDYPNLRRGDDRSCPQGREYAISLEDQEHECLHRCTLSGAG